VDYARDRVLHQDGGPYAGDPFRSTVRCALLAQSRIGRRQPSITLDRIRWKGEESFRVLSYYFSVRWNVQAAGDRLRYALGDFIVQPDPEETPEIWAPGLPPLYSIVEHRSASDRYHLLYGEGTMFSSDVLEDLMAQFFWHVNTQTIRSSHDFLLIHAGSVSTPAGDGVLLPARSGGGKTTLVTALVRAGFSYLSDEGGAVDPVSRKLYPYHRALTLKEGHAKVFPELYGSVNGSSGFGGQKWIHPADIRPGAVGVPCRIRFVIAHQYQPEATTHVIPITPAQAAMELLTNSLNLPRYRSRALPLVADVVRRARSFRMVSGNLDEAVQAIVDLTARRRRVAASAG
jgi:hypothetical protein